MNEFINYLYFAKMCEVLVCVACLAMVYFACRLLAKAMTLGEEKQ